eukprot:CFRG5407T1
MSKRSAEFLASADAASAHQFNVDESNCQTADKTTQDTITDTVGNDTTKRESEKESESKVVSTSVVNKTSDAVSPGMPTKKAKTSIEFPLATQPVSLKPIAKQSISIKLGGGRFNTRAKSNVSGKPRLGIQNQRIKPSTASVFGNPDDSGSEEEEMPLEARMRMRNVGKDTVTSAGPNSFGKTSKGFSDHSSLWRETASRLESEHAQKEVETAKK